MGAVGKCRLTGCRGEFVKAHLIPRAFTDLALGNPTRVEYGIGSVRPVLRKTSWFDNQLVTREGEDLLAKIDSDAFDEINKLGLCWRSFPITDKIRRYSIGEFDAEILQLTDVKGDELRLFFHSLLWRACASSRPEFSRVRVDPISMRVLKNIVAGKLRPSVLDFPCALMLLTTIGERHVHSPLRFSLPVACHDGIDYKDLKVFRFFLDGLLVYIGRRANDRHLARFWKGRMVGVDNPLIILGRPYEASRQKSMIEFIQDDMSKNFSEASERIYSTISRERKK